MIYHVRAKFRPETAEDLLAKLADGTIARQVPDGAEIVASMKRAVVTEDGVVEWTELCFCPSPLQHERSTVLDHYFDDITTEPVSSHQEFEGTPFLEYVASHDSGYRCIPPRGRRRRNEGGRPSRETKGPER